MKFSSDDVHKIAHLARLKLSGDEAAKLSEQLSAILSYVEKLNELDTSKVEPLPHVREMATPLREDAVIADFPREEGLANAPEAEQGMFRVPTVIEE